MLIDLILDRKDGKLYDAKAFYNSAMQYGAIAYPVATALDSGTSQDVQRELCAYIDEYNYNPDIKLYINAVNWL